MIGLIIGWIITGLIVGALGRLAIPGPNPMSIGKTILIGIGGAFVGGIVGYAIGLGAFGSYVVAVLAAAGIVYFLEKRNVTRPL
ncbi:MAG TPA: hypothetical protein VM390_03610 [Acidimicrobiales bacterium]|jgi:uncharacterized membrane protein YeaQ/YmgE (transglycosylase-associated protein family)|nr:hypothetical protein [Acidimicrobiales bacterium]